ncbi:MAG TPA: hypothetical protein VMM81_07905, partial [Acidimicrobiia bacterium]|nr:hypothetical protein [Acidimicrobiia bacterium]
MSNPPDIPSGELERPARSDDDTVALPDRVIKELWLSGTEAPGIMERFTSEGAQEMRLEEEGAVLAEQMGTLVVDDFEIGEFTSDDERQILNVGPQHPATHGVLRLQLELEGEVVRRCKPIIGYLHTGMEQTAEVLSYMQGPTNVTRMDYLAPFFNELCFSLAVERLMGTDIPPRAQAIRILMTELNRISSHLLWLATGG